MLLTACSLLPGGDPDAAPPQVTTTVFPSTTAATTTTTVVSDELTATSCPTGDPDFTLVCEAYDLIQENYVDPVDDDALADAAVRALIERVEPGSSPGPLTCPVPADPFLEVCKTLDRVDAAGEAVESILFGMAEYALDPNSAYLTPEALALLAEEQTGTVEGIGALVTTEDLTSDDPENTPCDVLSSTCPMVIVSTLAGSPAAAAGVQPDDTFVTVDGRPVDGLSVDEVTALVRGPAGTDVTITFDRDGAPVQVTITRAAIEIPVTERESIGDVGYLRLNMFTGNAGEQVAADLAHLLDGGATTVVLDLRDNPGGRLDAALDVASQFLADGVVVRTVGPDEERSYPVRDTGIVTDPAIEVVVLVNRGSASASEVVAGALQERGRATIVGERTFGKNTVQQRFDLSNGGAMRLTVARWITPEGVDFDDGIEPDVIMEIDTALTPSEIVALVLG